MKLINQTILFLFTLIFVACQCNNIVCETGPPDLNIQLVDSTGVDLISNGKLQLKDVELRNIKNQNSSFTVYFDGVISFSVDNPSADYLLFVNNIPIDTIAVTTTVSESDCCSSFVVSNVSINNKLVEFRPFLKLKL